MKVTEGPFSIIDARCPKCSWWVKVKGYDYDGFTDKLMAVWGKCKRHGIVEVDDYTVWP